MSPSAGNNLFLLEAIARRVALARPDDATGTTCVCFRFPELADLEVCDDGPCDAGTGKSCLFAVGASDLCRAARELRADVTVYRRRATDDAPRPVARAALRFDRTFTDIILDPDQPQKTRELVQTLPLYEIGGRSRRAGTVDVLVRLTSHGDLLVTEFFWDRDTKTYKYEGLDEYVPTADAPAPRDCPENGGGRPCPRKRCGRDEPAATAPKDHQDKYSKHVRRVECILDVMDKMKGMYLGAAAADVAKPCAFDPRCPVAGCPFVVDEPTRQPLAPNPWPVEPPRAVDDSDVFGVTVGPCRVDVPVYRNDFAQYSVANLPPSDDDPPQPPQPQPQPPQPQPQPPPSEVVVVEDEEDEYRPPAKKPKRKTKGKKSKSKYK